MQDPHVREFPPWFDKTNQEHWLWYYTSGIPQPEVLRAGETPRRPKTESQAAWKDRQPLIIGEEAYIQTVRPKHLQDQITIHPRHYDLLIREGHIEWLLNNNVRVARTRWPDYLKRVLRHLLGIDQSPKRG